MRVKICGIQNENELECAITAGADAVGFQVGQIHGGPYFILPSTAERLTEQLPPFVLPVLVTHLTRADEVLEVMERSEILTVQLLQPPLPELERLRNRLPRRAKIIVTEYVRYPVIDFDLSEYFSLIDAVNLDCRNQEPASIANDQMPKTAHWETARDFISESPVPVIISGRLTPDEVAGVAAATNPYAVDACTGLKDPATGQCDPVKVDRFIRMAAAVQYRPCSVNPGEDNR